jgi:chromosomal replication initiation ATPase DnaA
MKETVEYLIKRDSLKQPNRKRELVHKRAYLYNKLRESGMTLQEIGDIFERNKSSVCRWIEKYNELIKSENKILLNDINEYDNLFQVSN